MPRPKSTKRIELEKKLLDGVNKAVASKDVGLKSTTAYQLPKPEPDEILLEIGYKSAVELEKLLHHEDTEVKLKAITLGLKHFGSKNKANTEAEIIPSLDLMDHILKESEAIEEE